MECCDVGFLGTRSELGRDLPGSGSVASLFEKIADLRQQLLVFGERR
jgi:hypothetical protein